MLQGLHVLVAAAGQTGVTETRQEVGGNGGQEWAESDSEPQIDEGGIVEADACAEAAQLELLYGVQDHGHCRVSGVQGLQEGTIQVQI